MTLSKYLTYAVVFIIGAEIYHQAALALKRRLQLDDEIHELIFTREPLNYNLRLTRNIRFTREKLLHVMELLENIILSARKTVHVAMYIFTSDAMSAALIEAHNKGVEVLVIIDHSMKNASGTKIQRMKDAGIQVRIHPENSTLHHKMCLVDVPYKGSRLSTAREAASVRIPRNGLVISGSLNWTREALIKNEESFSVDSRNEHCQRSEEKFFKMWNNSE